jgi:hypothetical protein
MLSSFRFSIQSSELNLQLVDTGMLKKGIITSNHPRRAGTCPFPSKAAGETKPEAAFFSLPG